MGCFSSKPSKSKSKSKNPPRKSQISKPVPHPSHLPPTADCLPKNSRSKPISHPSPDPWPHHPRPVYVSPEEELRERVKRFQAPKPVHWSQARGKEAVRVPTGNVKAKPLTPPTNNKQATAAATKPKQQYQFKPLNEIGAPKTVKAGSGYGLYPPKQRGDLRNHGVPATAPLNVNNKNTNSDYRKKPEAKTQPRARFGGTRQDRHGEWWVLVLADGKWYHSKDVGVKPPAW